MSKSCELLSAVNFSFISGNFFKKNHMVKKHDQNIIKNRLTIFGLTSIFMRLNYLVGCYIQYL